MKPPEATAPAGRLGLRAQAPPHGHAGETGQIEARGLSRTSRWLVTVAATAASTYALDAIATAAGLALAASHVLRGVDHALLLAFLAVSYVVWAIGLRANLMANWALLEQTGTSTNALSKAAYELARLRTTNSQGTESRSGDRLRRHGARQGGAVLRGRVRRRAAQRLGLLPRGDRVPRWRQPGRRRLRVRARPPDAVLPRAAITPERFPGGTAACA